MKEQYQKLKSILDLRQEYENPRQEYENLRQEYEAQRFTHNLDANHNNVWKSNYKNNECKHPNNINYLMKHQAKSKGDI